jgi:hypothetical protein
MILHRYSQFDRLAHGQHLTSRGRYSKASWALMMSLRHFGDSFLRLGGRWRRMNSNFLGSVAEDLILLGVGKSMVRSLLLFRFVCAVHITEADLT